MDTCSGLTESQQELAAENHQLIYGFARMHGLNLDEFYDILAIALCHAAKGFNKNLGFSFTTFAYRRMDMEVRHYYQELSAQKNPINMTIISLDQPTLDGSKDSLYEIFQTDYFRVTLDDTYPYVKEFRGRLSEKLQKIVDGYLLGYNDRELGKMLKCTHSQIGLYKKQLMEQWCAYKGRYDVQYKNYTVKELKEIYAGL